jgi:hypothetical protein
MQDEVDTSRKGSKAKMVVFWKFIAKESKTKRATG